MAMRRPTGRDRRMVPAPDSRPKPKRREQTAQLPPQSEKDFQQAVVDLATILRYRVYHTWMSFRSAGGFPDLVLVRRPRVIFAELKSEKGQPSEAQLAWLDDLRASGQEAYLWRPSDWPEIERVLLSARSESKASPK